MNSILMMKLVGTSVTNLHGNAAVGISNGDVVKEHGVESAEAGTAELDGRGFGSYPAVGGGEVVNRGSGGLGADAIIACVNEGPRYERVVGVFNVNSIIVGGVEIPTDRHILDASVVASDQM